MAGPYLTPVRMYICSFDAAQEKTETHMTRAKEILAILLHSKPAAEPFATREEAEQRALTLLEKDEVGYRKVYVSG